MAYITKYGTIFGEIPQQTGRVHFVSPSASYTVDGRSYDASDDNDGLSPERALRTLGQAHTNVTANAGETVILLEGTHAHTATLRWSKAGVSIVGVRSPVMGEVNYAYSNRLHKSILSFVGAAAPGLSIEADYVEIGFLTLRPAPGFSTVIFRNASPDALWMHDVAFDFSKGQPSLATLGIDFGYRADTAGLAGTAMSRLAQTTQIATAYLSNLYFLSNGAYGPGVLTATADVSMHGARFHNRAGVWATAFAVATGTGYVFLANSSWSGQGTSNIAIPVDGTNAGIITGKVRCQDLRFGARTLAISNSPIDNFAIGVVEVIECYEAGLLGVGGATVSASI